MSYIKNILIAIDQLGNTLIGGSADETISSRFGRAIREDRCLPCKAVCKFLDLFEKNHCIKSIERVENTRTEVVHLSAKE